MAFCATCLAPASVIHQADGRATAACPAHDQAAHTWCARAGPVTTTRLTSDTEPQQHQAALF